MTHTCNCGAREAEVHRVACPVWLADERVTGSMQCECGKRTNHLSGGKCAVCAHWHWKSRGAA